MDKFPVNVCAVVLSLLSITTETWCSNSQSCWLNWIFLVAVKIQASFRGWLQAFKNGRSVSPLKKGVINALLTAFWGISSQRNLGDGGSDQCSSKIILRHFSQSVFERNIGDGGKLLSSLLQSRFSAQTAAYVADLLN